MADAHAPPLSRTMQCGDRPRGGSDESAVEGDSITMRFDNGLTALDRVSFRLANGRFMAIVGASGCGKSTLLRLVAGLLHSTEGNILVHGEPVHGPRADVAMMFQQPTLLPWKTALENVVLPKSLSGASARESEQTAIEYLELTGLGDFLCSYPRHLSGGMQQRVALARVLMTGARTLLLDEPFGALDEFTRERLNLELLRICAKLRANTLFVTHSISEAVFLADSVLVMSARPGRVAGVIDVPFERPRAMEVHREPEFQELVFRARALLEESH